MTQAEREKYRISIETKLAEVLAALKKREGLAVEVEADAFDEAQRLSERELLIHNLDRESILLRDLRAALARVADGTYGICLHCEDGIAPRRLAAVPWAPLCRPCQEKADAHAGGESGPEFWMAPAA